MELSLVPQDPAYKSASQLARRSTEKWAVRNLYCPSCGAGLSPYADSTPVYDFHSPDCQEKFQLKASKHAFRTSVLDSEYKTALRSLMEDTYPSLFLLRYDQPSWRVRDLDVVHRACISQSSIIPRKPLGPSARRAGWQGCLISLGRIPEVGRIGVVRDGVVRPKQQVLAQWKKSEGLLKVEPPARGWLADILRCVERLYVTFTLENVYSFEAELSAAHPTNRHVRAKVRQQLQVLRDLGFVEFVSPGVYRRLK